MCLRPSLRSFQQACLLVALACLAGCATPPSAPKLPLEQETHWQGKLSLKVYSKPVQALAANFDLQGRPTKGELVLTSPLGTTLARMQWDTDFATLTANGEQKNFNSLQELVRQAIGSDLPVASLFAWLQGRDDAAPGWQVDLKDLENGRIQAHHIEAVEAELKIILER
ncbi:lipoprotein insertase outer membrane protein LolB [Rhodoferax lacus]|nr:lipoprotein insertase outer membrane protein LolB [Rhodoferax lacus]